MDNIKVSIENLNEMLNVVDEAIRGINDTVGEAAGGVSDIAEKTSDMVDGTIKTSDKVDDCNLVEFHKESLLYTVNHPTETNIHN